MFISFEATKITLFYEFIEYVKGYTFKNEKKLFTLDFLFSLYLMPLINLAILPLAYYWEVGYISKLVEGLLVVNRVIISSL